MPKTPSNSSGTRSDSKRARAGRKASRLVAPSTAPTTGSKDDDNLLTVGGAQVLHEGDDLAHDLAGGEVPLQAHQSGEAELAIDGTADLR